MVTPFVTVKIFETKKSPDDSNLVYEVVIIRRFGL